MGKLSRAGSTEVGAMASVFFVPALRGDIMRPMLSERSDSTVDQFGNVIRQCRYCGHLLLMHSEDLCFVDFKAGKLP